MPTTGIVYATATPSFTSTFASVPYQVYTALHAELVDSNIEQERSDLNLHQISNQMQ